MRTCSSYIVRHRQSFLNVGSFSNGAAKSYSTYKSRLSLSTQALSRTRDNSSNIMYDCFHERDPFHECPLEALRLICPATRVARYPRPLELLQRWSPDLAEARALPGTPRISHVIRAHRLSARWDSMPQFRTVSLGFSDECSDIYPALKISIMGIFPNLMMSVVPGAHTGPWGGNLSNVFYCSCSCVYVVMFVMSAYNTLHTNVIVFFYLREIVQLEFGRHQFGRATSIVGTVFETLPQDSVTVGTERVGW